MPDRDCLSLRDARPVSESPDHVRANARGLLTAALCGLLLLNRTAAAEVVISRIVLDGQPRPVPVPAGPAMHESKPLRGGLRRGQCFGGLRRGQALCSVFGPSDASISCTVFRQPDDWRWRRSARRTGRETPSVPFRLKSWTKLAERCTRPASSSASFADRFMQTHLLQQIQGGQQIEFIDNEREPGNRASPPRVPSSKSSS